MHGAVMKGSPSYKNLNKVLGNAACNAVCFEGMYFPASLIHFLCWFYETKKPHQSTLYFLEILCRGIVRWTNYNCRSSKLTIERKGAVLQRLPTVPMFNDLEACNTCSAI
jgi:hypothetical protein